MPSMESQIAAKLKTIVEAVPGVDSVFFDKVRAGSYEFRDHELPAVQFWDVGQAVTHERGRVKIAWALSAEIIMKSRNRSGTVEEVDQQALWDLRTAIEEAIWADPKLGIPSVIHPVLTGNITDLHFALPYYIARIDFDVLFYRNLTGSC